jgi:hypothetical protein
LIHAVKFSGEEDSEPQCRRHWPTGSRGYHCKGAAGATAAFPVLAVLFPLPAAQLQPLYDAYGA